MNGQQARSTSSELRLMARAMQLAHRGSFTTHPNPRVGCVIARGEEVVGEGWHERAGGPHAEICALAEAGDRARGATAFVTLEPCCHSARTGACSEALKAAGVRRVVSAMVDPDPRVSGGGLRALAAAGIDTQCGLMEDEARALNPGFISRLTRGRPYLRAKLAMSLDGRTAMASGESKWITGIEARRDVQRFRAMSDAIVTGVGTIIADDPRLDVRPAELPAECAGWASPTAQPLRVVMDSRLRTPRSAQAVANGPTLIVTAGTVPDEARAGWDPSPRTRIEPLPAHGGRPSPSALVDRLARWPVNEVWLEAGATLCGAFVAAGLVDELILYCAPCLLGSEARGLLHLPGISRLDQRIELAIVDVTALGADLRIRARPAHGAGHH